MKRASFIIVNLFQAIQQYVLIVALTQHPQASFIINAINIIIVGNDWKTHTNGYQFAIAQSSMVQVSMSKFTPTLSRLRGSVANWAA